MVCMFTIPLSQVSGSGSGGDAQALALLTNILRDCEADNNLRPCFEKKTLLRVTFNSLGQSDEIYSSKTDTNQIISISIDYLLYAKQSEKS